MILFIHQVGGEANWIGIVNSYPSNSLYGARFFHSVDDVPVLLHGIPEKVNSMQQIGNTFSLVCDNNIYYILWNDGKYKYLGAIPELPFVGFSSGGDATHSKKFIDEYGVNPKSIWHDDLDNLTKISEENTELASGIVNKILDSNKTAFHDAFFIRYALRLYDGSICNASSPMLVMPQNDYKSLAIAYLETNEAFDKRYNDTSRVEVKVYTLHANYDFTALQEWSDIIKSVDFFATNYVGLANPKRINELYWFGSTAKLPGNTLENNRMAINLYDTRSRVYNAPYLPSIEERVTDASLFHFYYAVEDFTVAKTITFP